jgi:hypothetical protein
VPSASTSSSPKKERDYLTLKVKADDPSKLTGQMTAAPLSEPERTAV